jgi:hypothetical protein
MIINVTQNHIDEGVIEDCHHCPVAKAICEQVPQCTYIEVCNDTIRIDAAGRHLTLKTRADVSRFIDDFDGAGKVEPFSFELDLPFELEVH